jgi:hypothetical protein
VADNLHEHLYRYARLPIVSGPCLKSIGAQAPGLNVQRSRVGDSRRATAGCVDGQTSPNPAGLLCIRGPACLKTSSVRAPGMPELWLFEDAPSLVVQVRGDA